MQYDWESKITDDLLAEVENVLFETTGLTLAGIAVANTDTGQAALVHSPTGEGNSVIEADYRQDIMSDAETQYKKAVDLAFITEKPERMQ